MEEKYGTLGVHILIRGEQDMPIGNLLGLVIMGGGSWYHNRFKIGKDLLGASFWQPTDKEWSIELFVLSASWLNTTELSCSWQMLVYIKWVGVILEYF
jgi:hypothetical protein